MFPNYTSDILFASKIYKELKNKIGIEYQKIIQLKTEVEKYSEFSKDKWLRDA